MPGVSDDSLEANSLLGALDAAARARSAVWLQRVELRRGEVLHALGQRADRLYFPVSGLIAIHSETLAGESVQTGMVGCDGAIGAVEALGSGQYLSRGVVQVDGVALRLSALNFHQLLDSSRRFRSAVERYVEMTLIETRQLVTCNALHPVEGRLCRSILDALDRACLERALPLTQEALALMLGAQRTTVAVVLAKLQQRGIVRKGRGSLQVVDRARLERLACSCRKTLQFARDEVQEQPAMFQTGG